MSSPTGQEIHTLKDVNVNRYLLAANLTFLTYDYILTLGDEYRLVWSSRLSPVKVVFLLNRYLPFLATTGQMYEVIYGDASSLRTCKAAFQTFSGFTLINLVVAECILYFRAYAVWGGDRRALFIIILGYLGFFISSVYLTLKAILVATVPNLPRSILPSGCLLVVDGASIWSVYLGLIMSEFFALIMLVIKASRTHYSARMEQILNDGVAYFILMLITSTGTAFILRLAADDFSNVITVTQAIIHSIICSHLLLRIRKGYQQDVSHVISHSSRSYENFQSFQLTLLRALPDPSRINR